MDLLVEKGDSRTYLSRYKVITTSFEESSPSVKRNNTQIQYRNGNVDFGGWHEAKTIDYVGYYRADDIDEEETLREKIYALLSDPDGYYITQLKNDNDDSFERPGENTGDYFEKQVNRPSHKRFYVYANSLESELVGSYGGHVLYKISAAFTTMKLPYGESVPRDLDIKPNVPYYGRNLIKGSYDSSWGFNINDNATIQKVTMDSGEVALHVVGTSIPSGFYTYLTLPSGNYTASLEIKGTGKVYSIGWNGLNAPNRLSMTPTDNWQRVSIMGTLGDDNPAFTFYGIMDVYVRFLKIEEGTIATPWSPAPEDPEYNQWYLDTYYNTDNLVIPYAGTVPCNQLEQGFTVEFTAKEAGSSLVINVDGTELTYSGSIVSGDVFKLSGYEYTKNDISIVKDTNKSYFKLLPGIANKISSSIAGEIRILNFQNLYA